MQFVLDSRYDTPQKIRDFFGNLDAQVQRLPGVTAAGEITNLPLSRSESLSTLDIKGHPKTNQMVNARNATVSYFRAMGIPLIEGRFFTEQQVRGQNAEIVVSRSFSRNFLPGEPPIGQQLRLGDGNWHTVVGIVADVRHSSLEANPQPTVYWPFDTQGRAFLTVRATIPPERLIPSITQIARQIDPAITPEHAGAMRELVSEAISPRRFQTVVLSIFAGIAVFLALVGLYGLMAYAVKQRTAEIGIRIALGASARQVLGMVVGKGLALAAAGLAIGLASAFAITRLVRSWLYGVTPTDPVTFLFVPAMILAVAFAACLIPAWKATRIDPVTALRYD
jgi:predicted permease